MNIFAHKENFYLQTESGDEYEVDVDYDFSSYEPETLECPSSPAEFVVNEVKLSDSGFPIELDWIKNLHEFELEMASSTVKKHKRLGC